ncbi:hypothetical protein DBV15_11888, partial [Temnothorax longispinosus]
SNIRSFSLYLCTQIPQNKRISALPRVGHDHRMRHVDDRVELLVDPHVVSHLPAQQLPDVIEIGAELPQLVVLDVLQELGSGRPVSRVPVLELVAGHLERVVDELLHLVLVRRVVH